MLIGYARVSTTEQDLALQVDALKKAGCDQSSMNNNFTNRCVIGGVTGDCTPPFPKTTPTPLIP